MKTEITPRHFTSEEIKDMIAKKYPAPAFTTLYELRDGTGFSTRGRMADAVVFGTWPSRGLTISGFEVKSHRHDWLKELATPEKAESIARFCDEWWLVAADNIARLEEIPAAWGWLSPDAKGEKLKVNKLPQALEPAPISRVFLMSITRNIEKNYVPAADVKRQAKTQAEQLTKEATQRQEWELTEYHKLKKTVEEYKAASGVNLFDCSWRKGAAAEIGRIVKTVMDKSIPWELNKIRGAAKAAQDVLESLAALEIFKQEKAIESFKTGVEL